ncbi:MAG: bifunctional aldolase/short-chain dehydrogenase [Thermodesulfobacteriota bacterium]
MKSLFDEKEAQEFVKTYQEIPADLALCIFTSRLIGRDPSLVIHGGGNTSVKIREKDIWGKEREVLYIKSSGVDLAHIEIKDFVGLELEPLRQLQVLSGIADEELENQLHKAKISHRSPFPSVEALVHAFLPFRYIDHAHAEAILILGHLETGEALLAEALGPQAAIIPYAHPGLPLAKEVLKRITEQPDLEAVVVVNHGVFTFAEDARSAYERMIKYVHLAEEYIEEKCKEKWFLSRESGSPAADIFNLARLNQIIRGVCTNRPGEGKRLRVFMQVRTTKQLKDISSLPEAAEFCKTGVLTPDHVIRTRNLWAFIDSLPEKDEVLIKKVKESVKEFEICYEKILPPLFKEDWKIVDHFPRVFLVSGVGLITLGMTRQEASIAADIAERTLKAKLAVNLIGKYRPIPSGDALAMEFWPLQRKKIVPPPSESLQGEIAVITGAGGAIGLGIADKLLRAGSTVILTDIDEQSLQKVYDLLRDKYEEDRIEKIVLDVTDYESVVRTFAEISFRLGGLDIIVPNAGIAHVAKIEDLEQGKFERVLNVNLIGTFNVIKASIPIFRRQGLGGSVIVISSKNVFDPGAAFGAYSAAKAAAHQISKIAAMELAELGVRVNLVNPDAVFGDEKVPSKLWEMVGPERMKARGLDPEGLKDYYRQRNLLKIQVTAGHVGDAVVFLASQASAATTGATLPVDGGIPAAFPR